MYPKDIATECATNLKKKNTRGWTLLSEMFYVSDEMLVEMFQKDQKLWNICKKLIHYFEKHIKVYKNPDALLQWMVMNKHLFQERIVTADRCKDFFKYLYHSPIDFPTDAFDIIRWASTKPLYSNKKLDLN